MEIKEASMNGALARKLEAEVRTETALPVEPSASVKLRLGSDGRLWAEKAGSEARPVSVQRCFPWSRPLEWLSLRGEDGDEVELIENFARLDSESAGALVKALEEAAFVFTVEALEAVTEEFELRQWQVRLKEGQRVFQTKLNAWPRELPGGGLLIQDVSNDLYLIPDLEKLDPTSSKLLWAFMDED